MGNHGRDQPSLLKRILLLTGNNAWIRIPVTCGLALVFGVGAVYIILIPTLFLPDYVALPLAFVAGMILWGFLVGFPGKETKIFWMFSALIWGGAVCLVYAEVFRQRHHILTYWYWVGVGLQLLAAILGIIYHNAKKGANR